MILTQFTKGKQAKKNKLYRICGWIMVAAIICLVISGFIPSAPGWLTMLYEFIMLEAFSVAFLVKSGVNINMFKRG
jgi:cytochrome b subunit of formate dehydrogenase